MLAYFGAIGGWYGAFLSEFAGFRIKAWVARGFSPLGFKGFYSRLLNRGVIVSFMSVSEMQRACRCQGSIGFGSEPCGGLWSNTWPWFVMVPKLCSPSIGVYCFFKQLCSVL